VTTLLEAKGISVRFGGLMAVNDVDLAIPQGSIHGIIGPNGAGKTTFFNAITGLVQTSAGRITFDGADITPEPTHRRAQRGMRRTFQSVQLIPQLTVLENVLIGLHERPGAASTLRSLFGLSGRDPAEEAAQDRVVETLALLGIGHTLFRRPAELSFAEQRYVEIARALVSRPKLLMFDEPAAGLSPNEVQGLNVMLRRFRAQSAVTIILVEHVLSLVFDVSDRITVFESGRVIAEGPPAEIEADPKVKAAYLGEEGHA
jgi:branched-chain amino acid transport system ATP-binding protein